MSQRASIAALLFAIALGAATSATAQTTNGVISGIISDAQGGVLPGVTVTARNVDTGAARTIVTESDGRFRLGGLIPGRYELAVELQGFSAVTVSDLTVTVGTETTHNVTMQVQGLSESLTVTAEAPIVEVSRSDVSGVITQTQMLTLPTATRQPMDLALLMPGTSQDAVRARKANSNIGAGAFTNGSALLVDGVWNKEGNTGEPRQDFPASAIQEFKVFLSQSPAEYGWTAGGAVSMATKSGTNQLHGEGFEFYRAKALNAQDPFQEAAGQPKPDFSRHQYGGAIGGAIVKDKVHFFEAAEGLQNNLNDTVFVTSPQFYGNMNGTFPSPEYNHMSFTRGDVQLGPQQSIFLRYSWQDSDFTCEGCGASASAPWFSGTGGIEQKRYAWAGAHTWVISSRVLNELRGQYTNYHFRQHPPGVQPAEDLFDNSAERLAPLTPVYTFPSLSWGTSSNFYTTQWSREIRDDLTITAGKHTWKLGGGAQKLAVTGDNRISLGTWTFSVDQPFDPTKLSTFVPIPGSVRQFATGNMVNLPTYTPNVLSNFYVQDEWKLASGVTLNLGVRYDYQFYAFGQGLTLDSKDIYGSAIFPTTGTPTSLAPLLDFSVRGDKNNLGPRVGLAWDTRNDGKTVVRADYGIYYNPMNLQVTSAEQANYRQPTATIANATYPDPYGGRDPISFVSSAPANIAVEANNLENLQSAAYTAGISQALTSAIAIHVDGVYNRMTKIPMAIDINPRSGGTTGVRPMPQYARVLQTQPIGDMTYKALLVRLDKRFERNYMFMISYTLANTWGTVNNIGPSSTVTDSAHFEYDLGPNNSDRRHTLVASGTYLFPADVTVGAVFSYRSTMPFSAVAGTDLNGDAAITDFVPGTTRTVFNRGNDAQEMAFVNAWRATNNLPALPVSQINTNEYYSLDLRASKAIRLPASQRLEVIVQVFNLLNRKNLLPTWQTNALSPAFGAIPSAANMRQAEVAVRFTF